MNSVFDLELEHKPSHPPRFKREGEGWLGKPANKRSSQQFVWRAEKKPAPKEQVYCPQRPIAPRAVRTVSLPWAESSFHSLRSALLRIVHKMQVEADEQIFKRLVAEWKSGREPSSSSERLAMHPAYQQIIGIGPNARTLILREMSVKPDHWFWAMRAITRQNPVLPEHRGNLQKMTEDWLKWGKENKLV